MEVDPEDSVDLDEYIRSETISDWMAKQVVDHWRSLEEIEKQEIVTVDTCDLVSFSRMFMEQPWLEDFIICAQAFFRLHGTWDMYVCPDPACSHLFKDDESLIGHLKCDHFSEVYPVAWPISWNNLAKEQRFADALRKMVWKPIVVEAALELLLTKFLDYEHITVDERCAGYDQLESLNWMFSDNPERKRLLVELEKGFQVLLAKQEHASFALISDGLLMRMTALASNHVFINCPPRYNVSTLQCLLAHSPLSFCLLEARHLSQFVIVVEKMCQCISQGASCSAKREFDSTQFESKWSDSEILVAISTSLGDDPVKMSPLSFGGWETLFLSLCGAPSIPSIQRIPNNAAVIFSRVQEILKCLSARPTVTRLTNMITSLYGPFNIPLDFVSSEMGENFNSHSRRHLQAEPSCFYKDPDKLISSVTPFELELYGIQLVHELQCLESQLCQLCAINFQMSMSLLIGSLLRVKLYLSMKRRELGFKEGVPIVRRKKYQDENTEPKVGSDGSASECDTDYEDDESLSYSDGTVSGEDSDCEDNLKSESESERDLELAYKPWRAHPALCKLDSTLSESVTGKTEGAGPFFWMPISDVWRHCSKRHHAAGYESVREGIWRFCLNKTWKYWLCYSCYETFTDPESHMVHLLNKHQHQLCLAHEDYLLIPKHYSRDLVDKLRQDVVKRDLALEDSITLDHTCGYFLVDSTKLDQMPSDHEEEELGQAKCKQYMEIINGLHSEFCRLRSHLRTKRECLTVLEVLNAGLVLFSGGQRRELLMSWLRKLSSVDRITDTCQRLSKFLPLRLAYQPHRVQKVLENIKGDLICKIGCQDKKIVEALFRINVMKHNLSEHSVCDYRTKIMPSVRSLLRSKFRFDDGVISLGCNNIRNLLSSLDNLYDGIASFGVVVQSPGKVVINTRKSKQSWAIAFIGISLDFDGEWSLGEGIMKASGSLNFGGIRLSWRDGGYSFFKRATPRDSESYLATKSAFLPLISFLSAVSDIFEFLSDQYVKQNSGDYGVVAITN